MRLAAEGYTLLAGLFAVEEMTSEEAVASLEPDKLARVVAGLEGCLNKSYRARGGGCGPAAIADSSEVGAIATGCLCERQLMGCQAHRSGPGGAAQQQSRRTAVLCMCRM